MHPFNGLNTQKIGRDRNSWKVTIIYWNCAGTGVLANTGGLVYNTNLSGFQNNGTNKNPAAATDPAYIV